MNSSTKRNDVVKKPFIENQIFWTIDDLMKFTGLARQTIYNKVSKDELPVRRKWGKLYFIPDEIINLIEEGD